MFSWRSPGSSQFDGTIDAPDAEMTYLPCMHAGCSSTFKGARSMRRRLQQLACANCQRVVVVGLLSKMLAATEAAAPLRLLV